VCRSSPRSSARKHFEESTTCTSKSSREVEVPLSVLLLLVIVENTFHVDLFSDATRYTAAQFVNCCIAVTYPLNFFVYCAMSEQFRHMFCALFVRRANLNNAVPPVDVRRPTRIELA